MDRLYIITSTFRLAEHRARELGLGPNEWTAITGLRDAEKLRGTENPRVEYYGPGPEDLLEIEQIVRTRIRDGASLPRELADANHALALTTRRAWKVLDTCAILDCACSLPERESGHRVGCAVPFQRAALSELRAVLRRDGGASTVTGAIIDEPGLDERIKQGYMGDVRGPGSDPDVP